jgi:hypothetical protein
MRMARLLCVIPLLLLAGCGAQMRNLPVGAGRMQLNGSVGGPVVGVSGTDLPMPYALAGLTYGLSDEWDVYGDVHVLAAAFKIAGLTPGVVYFPKLRVGRWVPSVGVDALLFTDFQESRFYPEAHAALTYRANERWAPYVGFHETFQFNRQPKSIPSVYAGTSYQWGRVRLYGELQWLAADRDNRWGPVDYRGMGRKGAIAPQLGLTWVLPEGAK